MIAWSSGIIISATPVNSPIRSLEQSMTLACTACTSDCKREVGCVGSRGTKAPPAFRTPSIATTFHFYENQSVPNSENAESHLMTQPAPKDISIFDVKLTDLLKHRATHFSGPTPCA